MKDWRKWRAEWIDYALRTDNKYLFKQLTGADWKKYLVKRFNNMKHMVDNLEPLVAELEGNYNETRN